MLQSTMRNFVIGKSSGIFIMAFSLHFLIVILLHVCCIAEASIGDLARSKCKLYSKFAEHTEGDPTLPVHPGTQHVSQCQLYDMPFIIGGSRADRTEFPHMAHVGFGKFNDEKRITFMCGGSLISELFVLSAAHCARDVHLGPASAVRLGTIDVNHNDEHTHVVPIIKVLSHPDFNQRSKYNDIALFKMSYKVYFNEYIRPACIPFDHRHEWKTAIATGFGKTAHEYTAGSDHLLKVELDAIDDSICQQTYRRNKGVIESQFCAGVMKGSKDTCQGDSGGPLQIVLVKPHCMYSIVGITSYGKFCGYADSPAIYTNVSHYVNWIEDIVWKK